MTGLGKRAADEPFAQRSYVDPFCGSQRVLKLDIPVFSSAIGRRVAEQRLHGAQISCLAITFLHAPSFKDAASPSNSARRSIAEESEAECSKDRAARCSGVRGASGAPV